MLILISIKCIQEKIISHLPLLIIIVYRRTNWKVLSVFYRHSYYHLHHQSISDLLYETSSICAAAIYSRTLYFYISVSYWGKWSQTLSSHYKVWTLFSSLPKSYMANILYSAKSFSHPGVYKKRGDNTPIEQRYFSRIGWRLKQRRVQRQPQQRCCCEGLCVRFVQIAHFWTKGRF